MTMAGAKTGEELDRADTTARLIADRVMLALKMRGYATDETKVKTVILRETIQAQAQDVLLYHT